jgi:citrate lyase beta subunit
VRFGSAAEGAADARSGGAIGLDGQLVDIPLYDHAKRLLAQMPPGRQSARVGVGIVNVSGDG